MVGPINSAVALPASEIFADNGILWITPAATSAIVTERGLWNAFRTCGRDDQQAAVAADYIARNFTGRNVAIVHDKTTYGKGLADGTQKAINARGVKEVLYEGVNVGDTDFSGLVSRLKAANVELVYWGGLFTEGGRLVRQMKDQGGMASLMSGDGIANDQFAAIAGEAAVGTLMTYQMDPRNRPEAAAIVKKFKEGGRNFDPQGYTLNSYAALEIFKQAAEKAGSRDSKKVAAAMSSGMTFKTVIGNVSFDKKGDIAPSGFVMYSRKKGADVKITYSQD